MFPSTFLTSLISPATCFTCSVQITSSPLSPRSLSQTRLCFPQLASAFPDFSQNTTTCLYFFLFVSTLVDPSLLSMTCLLRPLFNLFSPWKIQCYRYVKIIIL